MFLAIVGTRQIQPMDTKLTQKDVRFSTLLFGIIALILLIPLHLVFPPALYMNATRALALGSAIFWGLMSILAARHFWKLYYRYFYPQWLRPLMPLNSLVYAGFGVGIWWLTHSIKVPTILCFTILGGIEGLAEHILAVSVLRVLEKVPFLEGLRPLPVLIFSFFEYVVYWALVAWLTLGLIKISPL
ncbi:MAG: hypothetical protein GTO14_04465 [Anaerolineales bacterium]|nr:hypothetical protein [Anaerolineales bacterium]